MMLNEIVKIKEKFIVKKFLVHPLISYLRMDNLIQTRVHMHESCANTNTVYTLERI